ncbi:MAG: hypothetical protein IKR59_07195 [Lachnospiraceae bacterium]|nr:hypothetical protein [Lachnospiraceae bacterium]
MISYSTNGRISGTWIAQRILSENLIGPGKGDLVFDGKRHGLKGLQFSEELKSDLEIMSDFRTIAHNVLYLFYFAEEQPYLRVPLERQTEELRAVSGNEPLTGMSLLSLFCRGLLRIGVGLEETVLYADRLLLSELPDAPGLLSNLVRTLNMYSGEAGTERIRIRPMGGIDTELLSDGLSISYVPEEESTASFSLDENTAMYRQVRETLTTLRQMMQDIDETIEDYREDGSRFSLSFEEGRRYDAGLYSIAVPDGFSTGCDADDTGLVMWLPNPENPDEWEASLFCLRALKVTEEASSETVTRENTDGGILRIETAVPVGEKTVRFSVRAVGVSEEHRKEAAEAVRLLTDSVRES